MKKLLILKKCQIRHLLLKIKKYIHGSITHLSKIIKRTIKINPMALFSLTIEIAFTHRFS